MAEDREGSRIDAPNDQETHAQDESAQKEVLPVPNQKEIVFDPDTMPQAVYPRGVPGYYGYYKPRPQPEPQPPHLQSQTEQPTNIQPADQQQVPFQFPDRPYPVRQFTEPASAPPSASSSYSPSQHQDGAFQKPIPITPAEKAPSSQKARRICGLAARTFYLVAGVVAVIIIAAVVGGAVGATVSRHSRSSSDTSTNSTGGFGGDGWENDTSGTETDLLYDSRLAAVNWTDADDLIHYAVFSQDIANSIMVSLWDADNQTWAAVNVSAALEDAGTPINVKERSPLAAVSTGPPDYTFEMHMYFLTPMDTVGEIYTTDLEGENWSTGDLMDAPNKTTSETSDLAAVWHRCDVGCAGYIYVAYEDDAQAINILNSSDWTINDTQLFDGYQIDPESGLAMIPFISDSGKEGMYPGELRLYWDSSADINELKFNTSAVWEGGKLNEADGYLK